MLLPSARFVAGISTAHRLSPPHVSVCFLPSSHIILHLKKTNRKLHNLLVFSMFLQHQAFSTTIMKNQQHLKAGVTTLVQNNWCATYTNTTQLLDESGSETVRIIIIYLGFDLTYLVGRI